MLHSQWFFRTLPHEIHMDISSLPLRGIWMKFKDFPSRCFKILQDASRFFKILQGSPRILPGILTGRVRTTFQRSFEDVSYLTRTSWCHQDAQRSLNTTILPYFIPRKFFYRRWEGWEGKGREGKGREGVGNSWAAMLLPTDSKECPEKESPQKKTK